MERGAAIDQREAVLRALGALRGRLASFVRANGGQEEVDDLLQVAALRAVERAPSLTRPERLEAWLFRVHRNVLLDRLRQRRSEAQALERSAAEPEPRDARPAERCGCSVTLARSLPGSLSAVLVPVDLDGASLTDTARALRITTNNATVRLHRARKALRARLHAHCGVTSARECLDCRCTTDGCCD